MTNRHSLAIDWDGTVVVPAWPEQTREFMPGAVEALKKLAEHAHIFIWSARISPLDPFTGIERDAAHVLSEVQYIRDTLDEAGLHMIDIWTRPGKPGATVYVDDKAERYHGRPGSWAALTEKILARMADTPAEFPALVGSDD